GSSSPGRSASAVRSWTGTTIIAWRWRWSSPGWWRTVRRSSPTRAASRTHSPALSRRCKRSARMSWGWPVSEPVRVGLLGWPVAHSVSPAMHNAGFRAAKLNGHYEALAIPPDGLANEGTRYVSEGFRGFNVTIPHKRTVLDLPQIAEISDAAQAIGAANTLTVRPDGTLSADNTDWEGFTRDLRMYRIQPDQLNCLILGTGGSADAVVYALEQLNARSITLISRAPDGRPDVIGYDALADVAPSANLVINCTPLGMSPGVDRSPWPDDVPLPDNAMLYDLVYNPPVTALMR